VVDWLVAGPEKAFFIPIKSESTPDASVVEWLRHNAREIVFDQGVRYTQESAGCEGWRPTEGFPTAQT
jgi:hypothetical protein